ncbi:MAG: 2-C-methyl-D-erythritol 4-phosphate cytidylyltransferase, partial [Proteobacteria bacterium]|nr:2-C-methyl-D-erythritol 4-phosphate cytidylyltransferase [Pseudomonadota bacterium]
AGKGIRMKGAVRKQYIEIDGCPVLRRTLKVFDSCRTVDHIILVIPPDDFRLCIDEIISPLKIEKKTDIIAGGSERQDSVYNGLLAVNEKESTVVIHDGVRPFVSPDQIEECVKQAVLHGACILGLPASDTLKIINGSGYIEKTMKRDAVWLAQTPQAFNYALIKKAHDCARKDGFTGTDDASLVERVGGKVKVINGSINNIKITTPEDLAIAMSIIVSGKL